MEIAHQLMYPFFAFVLVVSGIPLCIRLARRYGLYDEPDDERKLHHERVPYTGGIAIAGAFAMIVTVMWFVDGLHTLETLPKYYVPIYLYIVEAAFIIFMLGAVDDFRELSFTKKFVFQFIAALFIILGAAKSGIYPEFFSPAKSSVLMNSLGTVVTMLWLVGTTNAINMIDGLDGLAGGSALVSSLAMGVLAMVWGDPILAMVLFILAGALVGFLLFNRPPARVFMGDTGSMFTGFALAVCAWLLLDSAPARLPVYFVPVVLLGLPVFDTLLAFGRRVIAKRNPFSADTLHIHHMLQRRLGLSTRRTVLILYAVTLAYCAFGFGIAFAPETMGWVLLAAVAAGTLIFLHFLGYSDVLRGGLAAYGEQTELSFHAGNGHRNGNGHTNGHGPGNGSATKNGGVKNGHANGSAVTPGVLRHGAKTPAPRRIRGAR